MKKINQNSNDTISMARFEQAIDYQKIIDTQQEKYSNEVDYGFDYNHKKEDKEDINDTNDFNDDFGDDFGHVKNYYDQSLYQNMVKKKAHVKYAKFFFILMLTFFTLFIYTVFYKMIHESRQIVYMADKNEQDKALYQNEILSMRKKAQGISELQPVTAINIAHNKKLEQDQKIVPTIVNNYNFEQLNTGLATLGYSLLACFAGFCSFKGLSSFRKAYKIKKEIKRSRNLLNSFNVNSNDNQLAIGQCITDQIMLNNILISRLETNNTVVELMTINEKLKDTSHFINKSLMNNLKGDSDA